MNQTDLQSLAEMRLREAHALPATGNPCGAYYLAGYAVGCAMKACTAKQTQQGDFPDKKRALDAFDHSQEQEHEDKWKIYSRSEPYIYRLLPS